MIDFHRADRAAKHDLRGSPKGPGEVIEVFLPTQLPDLPLLSICRTSPSLNPHDLGKFFSASAAIPQPLPLQSPVPNLILTSSSVDSR